MNTISKKNNDFVVRELVYFNQNTNKLIGTRTINTSHGQSQHKLMVSYMFG